MIDQLGDRRNYVTPEAKYVRLSTLGIHLLTSVSYLASSENEDTFVDGWDEEGEL